MKIYTVRFLLFIVFLSINFMIRRTLVVFRILYMAYYEEIEAV